MARGVVNVVVRKCDSSKKRCVCTWPFLGGGFGMGVFQVGIWGVDGRDNDTEKVLYRAASLEEPNRVRRHNWVLRNCIALPIASYGAEVTARLL